MHYRVKIEDQPIDIIFLGDVSYTKESPGRKQFHHRGWEGIWFEEYDAGAGVGIDIHLPVNMPVGADTPVTMSICAQFNREIEFETEEETFRLGERGLCDYLFPAIQNKADEHWKRIRNMIDAFAKDKEALADNEDAPAMMIKMVPPEDRLYHKLQDLGEPYGFEMFHAVIKKLAEEMDEAKIESEKEP